MPKVVNKCVHIIVLISLFSLGASPHVSAIKNLPAAAGDTSLSPGLGRCPGEANGNPLRQPNTGNPVFLPGKSNRQINLAGYCLWGHKESYVT